MIVKLSHITAEKGDTHGLCGTLLEVGPAEAWQLCQECLQLAMNPEDDPA